MAYMTPQALLLPVADLVTDRPELTACGITPTLVSLAVSAA